MKFYSEQLDKLFDTTADLVAAETKAKKIEEEKARERQAKAIERANRAKEVENALKKANESQKEAMKLLKDFTKDFGYFHFSFSDKDVKDKDYMNGLNFLDEILNIL